MGVEQFGETEVARQFQMTIAKRLMKSVEFAGNGCWNWTAAKSHFGYGNIFVSGRGMYAHRVSYQLFKGPIPEGLSLDHLCRNPSCLNPEHLEPVTHKENMKRGFISRGKGGSDTHCPRNHERNDENTHVSDKGIRSCRACARERAREKKARLGHW